jgi:hypothetical protein
VVVLACVLAGNAQQVDEQKMHAFLFSEANTSNGFQDLPQLGIEWE